MCVHTCVFLRADEYFNVFVNLFRYPPRKTKVKITLNTKALSHCAAYSFEFTCNKKVLFC